LPELNKKKVVMIAESSQRQNSNENIMSSVKSSHQDKSEKLEVEVEIKSDKI
jgi:hypothetical protein